MWASDVHPDVSGLITYPISGQFNAHPHSPAFGGEIAWNDIDLIKWLNGEIYRQNFNMVKSYNAFWTVEEIQAVPDSWQNSLDLTQKFKWEVKSRLQNYVVPINISGGPSMGYNQHTHEDDFSGGQLNLGETSGSLTSHSHSGYWDGSWLSGVSGSL